MEAIKTIINLYYRLAQYPQFFTVGGEYCKLTANELACLNEKYGICAPSCTIGELREKLQKLLTL